MNINKNNFFVNKAINIVQHYNEDKYWKRREKVISKNSLPKFLKYYYLFYIKRCDAFNNASFGTDLNAGAQFKSIPSLPHGLNGIIISHYAIIGENCTIHQQVTIAQDNENKAAQIGDNVMIGAGAKIIGGVKIGNNVNIGANCIVVEDIPDNATVVLNKPRIIIKNK